MEKAPIKKFAVEARRKLIADVTFQLERYGITENGIVEPQTSTDKELVFDLGNGNVQTIRGVRAVNQYKNLAAHVRGFYTADEPKKELEQFIEEIAYTWFNRLIAIRFMEVNRYLPVRVLSSEITGQKLPDLVKAPFSGDLEFTEDEKKRIFELQDANKEDDLFRFLFFKQCNDLSRYRNLFSDKSIRITMSIPSFMMPATNLPGYPKQWFFLFCRHPSDNICADRCMTFHNLKFILCQFSRFIQDTFRNIDLSDIMQCRSRCDGGNICFRKLIFIRFLKELSQ